MKNGFLKYCFLFLAFLFIVSSQLKAAWCMTTNTVNAGVVVPPNITTSPSLTTTVSGATKSGKIIYWSFTGTSGLTYHFDLSQSVTTDNDTQLYLYNGLASSGTQLAANDDYNGGASVSGATHHAGIDWTCSSTGTYYVVAMQWASSCGATFSNNGNIVLNCYYNFNSSCGTMRNLPFTENFDSWGSCWSPSLSLVSGSGSSSSTWTVWGSNEAGATAPEAVFAGNQACAGCVESSVYRLTQPLKTYSVTSMQIAFKHSLYTTSGTTSGSSSGNLYLETSSDGTTWTTRWTQAYSGSTSSSALQTLIYKNSVTTTAFNPNLGNASNNNLTYVRFRITGVLFKVYQWYVDMGTTTPLITLPVEFVDFTAEKSGSKEVALKWETATEKNNAFFVVERSIDGTNFEEIQTIKGSGNSDHIVDYNTIDPDPKEGINYYRLKLTGVDGMPTYSKVRYVEFLGNKIKLGDVYPNPTSQTISFDLYAPVKGTLNLQIIDCTGRIVKEEAIKTEEGKTIIDTNLEQLAQGVYYLKTTFDKTGDQVIKKIIKN